MTPINKHHSNQEKQHWLQSNVAYLPYLEYFDLTAS